MAVAPIGLENRLAFLNLGPDDLTLLGELRPQFEEQAEEFWQSFRRELAALEPLASHVRRPEVERVLARLSREYLLSFTQQHFGATFIASRQRLGRGLQRIGLEAHWVLRGYALYFSLLVPRVSRALHDDQKSARLVTALAKRVMLDAELAMDAYIDEQQRSQTHRTGKLIQTLLEISNTPQAWRTNARELEKLMERVLAPCDVAPTAASDRPSEAAGATLTVGLAEAARRGLTLHELENLYMKEVLAFTGGRKIEAARRLGIDRKTLYRRDPTS